MELTYKDETGKEVKTAHFLRNRGTCCKTTCRHCPYGHTLREKGLQFSDYHSERRELAEQFFREQVVESFGIAASLLAEGVGAPSRPAALSGLFPRVIKIHFAQGQDDRPGRDLGDSGCRDFFG